MQQRIKVTIDDNDDDDDDDVKQEVTDTIEKFIQTRHVQTLKYLRHVIDENRQLRFQIEHLERHQDDPIESPDIVDPIEPEKPPIIIKPIKTPDIVDPIEPEKPPIIIKPIKRSDIVDPVEPEKPRIIVKPIKTPEKPIVVIEHIDEATNTEGEDYETKYHELNDELINIKKQHHINREEFQREIERVDHENIRLEKDLKSAEQQLIIILQRDNDKQIEIQKLTSSFSNQKMINEDLNFRVNKLEQTNKILTQSLLESEQTRVKLETQLEELRKILQQTEQKLSELKIEYQNNEEKLHISEEEIDLLKRKLDHELNKYQELNNDNEELRENIKYLKQQIQEKVAQEKVFQEKFAQEQQKSREKQLDSNFKDFIQVKRTLQACQQENEQLKIELKKLQIKFLNKTE